MEAVLTLGGIAAEQWGLVTAAQARVVGISPQVLAQLADRGALDRLRRGVYRLVGAAQDRHTDLRAAWLTLAPERTAAGRVREAAPAVVSLRSAAVLHDLGDVDADVHEFSLGVRRQTRQKDIRIHRQTVEPEDWTLLDGLPVTTPARTISDLAAAHLDGGHLGGAVRDAVARDLVSRAEIAAALAPIARRYGARPGDGHGLVCRLLAEAGWVDDDMVRQLSGPATESMLDLARSIDLRTIEQAERLARELGPRRLAELRRLAEAARRAQDRR